MVRVTRSGKRLGRVVLMLFLAVLGQAVLMPDSSAAQWSALPYLPGWESAQISGYDWYRYQGVERYRYQIAAGQWEDRPLFSSTWSKLGPTGMCPTFIGDHNSHTTTTGWQYKLWDDNVWGVWLCWDYPRYRYDYTSGKWENWSVRNTVWTDLGQAGLSSAFLGDFQLHNLGDPGMFYQLWYDYGWDLYWDCGQPRFRYQYSTGQWSTLTRYDYPTGKPLWADLGSAGRASEYIGDHTWHTFADGSSYKFWDDHSWGVFKDTTGAVRFRYQYWTGQWQDYYAGTRTWSNLGKIGQLSAFVGDGTYHALWGSGDTGKYQYLSGNGYWASSGVANDDDFRFSYGTGQWYRYSDGSTAFENVSYLGNRQYVLADYIYWTTAGLKSSTATGSSYGTDVKYVVWNDPSNAQVAYWYIFTPGSDLKWSGGTLQVAVVDSSDQGGGYGPWMLMCEQYTKNDVVVLEYPFEGGATLSQILQGLAYVTTYYGKTIDDLAVMGHGNTTGFYFGNWISTWNYASTYGASWTTLNTLMTDGGHFMLYHCETGSAASMLNTIASWTNTRVFANVNLQWDSWMGRVNSSYSYGASNVWNSNYIYWFMGRSARESGEDYYELIPDHNFIDLDFEYQSYTALGKRGYHMLFDPYNIGWPQADMVYWWNNGNGRL